MKIKTITVNAGRTVAVERFQFVRADFAVTVEVDDDDNMEEVEGYARDYATKECDEIVRKMLGNQGV